MLAARGHEVINLSLEEPQDDLPATTYCADLTDRQATADVLARIIASHDVRMLVNNAGFTYVTNLESLDLDRMQAMIEIHLRAAAQCIQAVVPGMKQAGYGRIVSIGSRMMLGRSGRTVYGMVKAGLLGMSRSLALELAPCGITVNMVSPGPIETELFRLNHPPGAAQTNAVLAGLPVGRIGLPEDVSNAVGFFMSDASGFVTGQNLFVCGGGSVGSAPA
ncbi:SDR family oxidoreductase [Pigmentiphaga litoralis]|uniref:SDR family oxidoreductase n=1 Tax=Pigmentiphaga litoralis TaxID=516702 RepID=UPI003B433F5A